MPNNYGPRIVTNGLMLCLDAANTKSYPGSGTVWTDISRNGRNGTLINGPTFSSSNGGIIQFDGTNDYVTFGNTLAFAGEPFSFNMLFYLNSLTTSTAGQGPVLFFKGGFQSTGYYFQLPTSSASDGFFVTNGASSVGTTTLPVWNPGFWYDLCITRNGTSIRIYVNGRDVTNVPGTHSSMYYGSESFLIGAYGSNPFIFNSNRVATFKAYNRTLSVPEILQNYDATKARFKL